MIVAIKTVKMIIITMIRMQEFEHVILESALENVVNKFRRHITIKVKKDRISFYNLWNQFSYSLKSVLKILGLNFHSYCFKYCLRRPQKPALEMLLQQIEQVGFIQNQYPKYPKYPRYPKIEQVGLSSSPNKKPSRTSSFTSHNHFWHCTSNGHKYWT